MNDEIKVLSRADFISATQLKRELVPVPELGGAVYISELYGAQVLAFNERIQEMKRKGKKSVDAKTSVELMALLISMSAVDASGKPLFTEADAKLLARSNVGVLVSLSAKAMEISGLNTNAVDEVKEQLKKNLTDGSTSD